MLTYIRITLTTVRLRGKLTVLGSNLAVKMLLAKSERGNLTEKR
jgi:hypothetical protein